ncbi:MAG: LytR/AlgR family response regulator transcription factor, partial [Burkholderiales bacterium]
MSTRAVIAEDEAVLRAEIGELLADVWPELEIVAMVDDGLKAVRAIERHRPDVLFLDIAMPALSGLDVARAASGRCHVVFVTAYDQHAVAAFEHGAVDYLMKPISAARLLTACNRVRQRLSAAPANLDSLLAALTERRAVAKPYLRWINASKGNEIQILTTGEICYFQSDAKYTRAVTPTSEALLNKTVKALLDELDPAEFRQIHRGTIVNLNAIG